MALKGVVVEFRLLGPIEVWSGGRLIDAGPPRQRSVLAVLLADAGRAVPVHTVIDRVWGEAPPRGARSSLHAHVARVRRVLRQAGAAEVVSVAGCYRLDADGDTVDLHRLRSLAARARAADPSDVRRVTWLREAVTLWRGEPLSGLRGAWADETRQAWSQQYLDTVVTWAEAELDLADPAAPIETLTDLAERFPLTEPVTAVLMRALTAAGRPADALARYELTRRRLSEELGTDPSTGLQALHRTLLQQPDPPPAPVEPRRAPRTLPSDVTGFVGRSEELHRLLAAAGTGRSRAAAVHAVDGMAGVGKTVFAVHAAHHLADRFPDGQHFLDLRAHDPGRTRLDTTTALETLLQADGVTPQQIPAGPEARAALWRDRASGKRLLLVLDDAADPAHVTPLLPAAPGSLVLITSRRKLTTLPGAVHHSLDTLPATDAAALLTHRAASRAHDAEAVERITRLCGHLPLAITLTAARLHTHPAWTLADLADDLQHAQDRLAELASGDLAVAAAFDLSYRDLPPGTRRLFRRLALHPGPDFDTHAGAALDDTTVSAARRGLEQLLEHNLLTEPFRGRYRFHDLIAEHARAHAAADPPPEQQAALDRLLDHYTRTATGHRHAQDAARGTHVISEGHLSPGAPGPADPAAADDWFTLEYANLIAVARHAAGRDHPAAVAIPAALNNHLRDHGPFDVAIDLYAAALTTADRIADRPACARTLAYLATMHYLAGSTSEAVANAGRAHTMFRDLDDHLGQADALTIMSLAMNVGDDKAGSLAAGRRALALYERMDDPRGQANALISLAWAQGGASDYSGAAVSARRAHDLHQKLGNRQGQARALGLLGRVHRTIGDYPAALTECRRALALFHRGGDRRGRAVTLCALAQVQADIGDHRAAAATAREADVAFQQIGAQRNQNNALLILADTQVVTGDHAAAAVTAERALAIADRFGDPSGRANALQRLGRAQHGLGDHPAAAASLERAHAVFAESLDPDGEAETLNDIGRLRLDTAEAAAAHQAFTTALAIARRIGTPLHEAQALEGIGHGLLRRGRDTDGLRHLDEALAIYRRLDSPHLDRLQQIRDRLRSPGTRIPDPRDAP